MFSSYLQHFILRDLIQVETVRFEQMFGRLPAQCPLCCFGHANRFELWVRAVVAQNDAYGWL